MRKLTKGEVFLGELVNISDRVEMESLLKTLLSESEYLMIAKRLVAFVLIDEGYTDVQIARVLHITRPTACRLRLVYRTSKEKQEPVVKVVGKLKDNEEFKKVLKRVLFKYVIPMALGRIPKIGIIPWQKY